MIPYSRQSITKTDIEAVKKVLKSKFLSKGPMIKSFERKISEIVKSNYCLSANSGTSALHLACLALQLKKNDIVWTVPNTYAASANCALHCGATIDFVDIDEKTYNISIEKLKTKLISAQKTKRLPKVIIPVHLAGQPTDQKEIWKLSKKYKFKIIEDASHSLGATNHGEKVGSCKWSDLTVFSFHPVKIITTGEGGMVCTNNKKYFTLMKKIRENGIAFENKDFEYKKIHPGYYEHQMLGFNYRMSEISAALGLSQIKRLKENIKERNKIAKKYYKALKNVPINFQSIRKKNLSSFHLFIVQFDLNESKFNFKKIFELFRKKRVFVNQHYMPLHLSPYFKRKGFKKNQFPNSENYSSTCLSIPIYPGLKRRDFLKVVKLIKDLF